MRRFPIQVFRPTARAAVDRSRLRTRSPEITRAASFAMLVAVSCLWILGAGSVRTFAAATFYVAPNGSPSGTGSAAQPLDIVTALSSASPARPGDTIWVRGGTYRGPITSQLAGTASAPISVRQYPGERATIDGYPGGGTPLSIVGSNVVFWGLEVMSSDTNRVSGQSIRGASGIDVLGANVKVINMVVHDNINGIGAWMVPDTELYGNVIYNNGVDAPDRGHGHSIYAQNNAATPKRIIDNVLLNSYSIGMQAYTQGGRIDNIYLEGNIAFNHGILSVISGVKANFLWQGPPAVNPSLISNYSYYSPGLNGRTADLTGPCVNAVLQNNYLVQGWIRFECGPSTVTGNTIYGDPGALSAYSSNTFLTSRPSGVQVFVRPNRYELGRGNIAIFNWAGQSQVSVDLSTLGLAVGSAFEIRDAENFYGSPVVSGTYDGNPVSIRMTGLTVVSPIGGLYTPPHTAPEFGAFVVLPRATTGTVPTASLSASPSSINAGQSSTLTWTTTGASSVSLDPGVGAVSADGSATVMPQGTTTYTLTAISAGGGITTQNVIVAVTAVPLPTPWVSQDIGSVGLPGSATSSAAGTFTLQGAGSDIFGPADAFQFVFQPLTGDGQIVARVASVKNTDPWAKAGVMIREDLTAGARNAAVVVTPGNGVLFQYRAQPSGDSLYSVVAGAAPTWVKLVRTGPMVTGYRSTDGTQWTVVGSQTVNMASTVYVGLALTSHNNTVLSTAAFDNVSTAIQIPPSRPTGLVIRLGS